jgi:hypothetical protein
VRWSFLTDDGYDFGLLRECGFFGPVQESWRIGFMKRQARGREEEDFRLMIVDFGWLIGNLGDAPVS